MVTVPTARGEVDVDSLGRVLMHEHVFVLTPDVQQNHDEWDEDARVADAVTKLTELAAAGIGTIVDPTVIGLGRYVPRVVRVAEQVPLNIVVATGVYTYDSVPFYFHDRGPGLGPGFDEPMTPMFVRDLTTGIPGTDGVRAAFLKCAVDKPGLTPDVERILRAVAAAHLETGAPVMVHTHAKSQRGLDAHRVLQECGVAAEHVLLAHCGDSTDADHLSTLADLGYLLGMDRFGIDTMSPFEDRVAIVVELVRRGYADRMVLAHDAACYIDWVDPQLVAVGLPRWHYRHITDDVLPALRAAGVGDAEIDQMLVDNPRRYFAGAAR